MTFFVYLASVLSLGAVDPDDPEISTREAQTKALIECLSAVAQEMRNGYFADLDAAWAETVRRVNGVCLEDEIRRQWFSARKDIEDDIRNDRVRTPDKLAERLTFLAVDWERSLREAPPMGR